MSLRNRINKQKRKAQLLGSDEKRLTISMYRYFHLRNPQMFRDHLYTAWEKMGVFRSPKKASTHKFRFQKLILKHSKISLRPLHICKVSA